MADYPGNNDWIANGASGLAVGADTSPGLLRMQESLRVCFRGVFLLGWLLQVLPGNKLSPQSLSQSGGSEGHSPPSPLWTPLRHWAEGNSPTRKEPEPSHLPHLVSWNAPGPRLCLVPATSRITKHFQRQEGPKAEALCPERGGKHSLSLEQHRADPFLPTQCPPVPAGLPLQGSSAQGIWVLFPVSQRQKDSSLPSLSAQSHPTAPRG